MINPNLCIVEGAEERRTIPYIINHYQPWGDNEAEYLAEIRVRDGIDNILQTDYLQTEFDNEAIKRIGIIIDANDSASNRYASVRDCCLTHFPNLPEQIDPHGVIVTNQKGKRLGIWIMPDNSMQGMLETFLGRMVDDSNRGLWEFAQQCAEQAKNDHSAPYLENHTDKAKIHTFLSWQDEPGNSLGLAVQKKIFKPDNPAANPFVEWFLELYELQAGAA
ncbi:hypothetical protein JXA32_07030 [Candidatus Sumerlaeota bacterium]|nr:hypothetical protein [Candidatus Sumerlaeota bacterium]